eukprot:6732585-Prymnesium_polylepis.2
MRSRCCDCDNATVQPRVSKTHGLMLCAHRASNHVISRCHDEHRAHGPVLAHKTRHLGIIRLAHQKRCTTVEYRRDRAGPNRLECGERLDRMVANE